MTRRTLYHVTTPKKLARYEASGRIPVPVRGWTTIEAAREWARRVGRSVILRVEGDNCHKIADHRSSYGEAWWIDHDVQTWEIADDAPTARQERDGTGQ